MNAPLTETAPGRSTTLAEGRALLRLALPIMLIAFVNMGMSITDAVMVSAWFGADALAGVPLLWCAPDWLRHFGLDAGLLERGRGYTQSMAVLLVPMLGIALYRTVLTAAERPKVFLYVTLAMLPLNAVLNAVLMKGLGPLPALGPTGAGVSSVLVALTSLGPCSSSWRGAACRR